MTWPPTDAEEYRELRDQDSDDQPQQHDLRCRGGWLGEDDDGRPVPCLECRPHLRRGYVGRNR